MKTPRPLKDADTTLLENCYRGLLRLREKRLLSGNAVVNNTACAIAVAVLAALEKGPIANLSARYEYYDAINLQSAVLHRGSPLGLWRDNPLNTLNEGFRPKNNTPFAQEARYKFVLREVRNELKMRKSRLVD